ncbi:MAG: hypothetical protein AB8B68_03765 [Rickettsiaceae bacterium]
MLLVNTPFLIHTSKLGFKAATVILNTLKTNFDDIYDANLNSLINEAHKSFSNENIFDTPLIPDEEQIKILAQQARENNVPTFLIQQSEDYFQSARLINPSLVEAVKALLAPIIALSRHNPSDYREVDFNNIALKLAFQFGSSDKIIQYLNKLDLSTHKLLENSVVVSKRFPDLSIFSPAEKVIWYELNIEICKPALKLFAYADLLKLSGVDIMSLKIIADYAADNQNTSNKVLFALLTNYKDYISFTRELECPELATLCREYDNSEYVYNNILDGLIQRRMIDDQLPNINFLLSNQKYSFEKLEAGNLKTLFIGKMSESCYGVEYLADADQCVVDAFTRADAGFYVLKQGNVIEGAINAWIGVNDKQEDVLVLNSFESRAGRDKYLLEILLTMEKVIKQYGFHELYFGANNHRVQIKEETYKSKSAVKTIIDTVIHSSELSQIIYDYLYKITINPKYQGLFVYSSAESVYKVTQNSTLLSKTFNQLDQSKTSCINFDFILDHAGSTIMHPQIKEEISKSAVKTTINHLIDDHELSQIIYDYLYVYSHTTNVDENNLSDLLLGESQISGEDQQF